MKTIQLHFSVLFSSLLFSSLLCNLYAQTEWSTSGNSVSSGDFIGTSNAFPFIIKSDNTIRMVIDENGVVTIKTLEGTEIRMLQVNEYGELIALEAGSPTEILNGEGEWVAMPVSLGTLNGSGDAIFANKVGIGTSSPTKELEITGDALIQGLLQANLIQAGGIKLSSLTGSGNRVVIANSVGELEVLSAGNADEVLNGEGNWIELPVIPFEVNGAGDTYLSTAKLGIGVSNPTKPLHVEGEALFEGDITTDTLYAQKIQSNTLEYGLCSNLSHNSGIHDIEILKHDLSPGVYHCMLESNNRKQYVRFVIL